MKKSLMMLFVALCAPAAFAAGAGPSPEECLSCHGGTLEKLAGLTAGYKTPAGDAVNPHTWLDPAAKKPHESRKLPECLKCHEAHPLPPKSGYKPKKATVDNCYGCHHMETFESCSSQGCHAGRK